MPDYLAPGLFVEEIDSGSKPIEGVGTNTAAFIGYAKSGEFNKPTFISNWTQFVQLFGEEENALTTALCKELNLTVADVRTRKKASRKSWMEFAAEEFKKANPPEEAPGKTWRKFLQENNVPQDGSPYIKESYLAHSVKGYYDNGGGRAYIIRVAHPDDIKALKFQVGHGADGNPVPAAPAQITAGPLLITAKAPGTAGNNIKVEVKHTAGNREEFTLKVFVGSEEKESFPANEADPPLKLDTAIETVTQHSMLIKVQKSERATATATRPAAQFFDLKDGLDASNVAAQAAGNGAEPQDSPFTNGLSYLAPDDFVGDEAKRTGTGGLVPVEDVNFICAPDLMAGLFKRKEIPGSDKPGPEVLDQKLLDASRKKILNMQCGLVAHCERPGSYRMAIIDPLPGQTPQEVRDTTKDTAYNCDKGQAALYYPWISIADPDPKNKGMQMMCPPCGHIAGVWARTSSERGVHKAPANEALIGAVGLEYNITKGEQEILNPDGINCIRPFSGRGIRVWGARTLATHTNPSWKYVNVRRLFNFLEQSLDNNLQWVVFEPNDPDLWGRVRRNIAAFLFVQWKEGMLFGNTPSEAFYVKCNDETNTQETIDMGRLYVEIGVNPVKPAEFVIIRMGQWSGGGSMTEQ